MNTVFKILGKTEQVKKGIEPTSTDCKADAQNITHLCHLTALILSCVNEICN